MIEHKHQRGGQNDETVCNNSRGTRSCGVGVGSAQAADPVRIGFSLPLTGIFAPAAPSQKNAYELWREQVNAKGGLDVAGTKRMVEFVSYDDQSDPGQAAKIYEKLIAQDKVDLLLGPWGTPHHFAVAGVLERYKFPMVGDTAASVQLRDLKPGYIWFPTSALARRARKAAAAAVEIARREDGRDHDGAASVRAGE